MRIAVIDKDKCSPKQCSFECSKYCPKVRSGVVQTVQKNEEAGKAVINEKLCIGCGICCVKCPFKAIEVVNLPEMKGEPVHQYGENGFRIFNFPIPKKGMVVGMIGSNGLGKTTVVKILSGDLKPSNVNIIKMFKGSEAQKFFTELYNNKVKVALKPQHVDSIPKLAKGKVRELLKKINDNIEKTVKELEIEKILDNELSELSGGELQRVAIAATLLKKADYYLFDEPSSYLDINQRLKVARIIRQLCDEGKGVIVIEHDLIVLDYLADLIHIVYGKPGVYGIVSHPLTAKEGINTFLRGYLRDENVRFRDYELKFATGKARKKGQIEILHWSNMIKRLKTFTLTISDGTLFSEEVIGILGPNATGKTTFAEIIAKQVKTELKISYKPQYLKTEDKTVLEFLHKKISTTAFKILDQQLDIQKFFPKKLTTLSGGELQLINITSCLCDKADIYLLDEPSAYLDVEMRVKIAKLLVDIIQLTQKSALIIDHDLIFLDYLSDRGIVFYGIPSIKGETKGPMEVNDALNFFLKQVGITFRHDPVTHRPRANKEGSVKDREQKRKGQYYTTV